MPKHKIISVVFLFLVTGIFAQEPTDAELRMNFPGIYFKHSSTDYAAMPYTADSCFKYIAAHMEDINSLVMWRDSAETEQLTNKRIKKIKTEIGKYISSGKVRIQSMGALQKVSRITIEKADDEGRRQFLISLNSVFDVSGVVLQKKKWTKKPHTERPRLWCLNCWKRGRFKKEYRKLHVKH